MDVGRYYRIWQRLRQSANFVLSLRPKYLWGGDSPASGLDCSGLANFILSEAGYVGDARTVDQFKTLVFKNTKEITSLPVGLSRALSAYFWTPTVGADATHMAIAINPITFIDSDLRPVVGWTPTEVHTELELLAKMTSMPNEETERFWELASLIYTFANSVRAHFTDQLYNFGLSGLDFPASVMIMGSEWFLATTGKNIDRTESNVAKIYQWKFSMNVVKAAVSAMSKRPLYEVDYEVDYMVTQTAGAKDALLAVGSSLARKSWVYIAYLVMKAIIIDEGLSRIRFPDFWSAYQEGMSKDTTYPLLGSGVKVRHVSHFTDPRYERRFMPVEVLDQFLELDAPIVQLEDIGGGNPRSVPIRRA